MSDRSFERYIRQWIREYGTAERLATAIGMSLSAFSRGVRNEQTLGIYNCLRFAEETGEPPSKVLHLASKAHVAALIERLYGPAAKQARPLSGPLREHLEAWQALTDDERDSLTRIIRQYLALRQSQPKRKRA